MALFLLVAIAAAGYATAGRVLETTAWVDHTHDVIERLDELRVALIEAESARRAHGLTGDEAELDAYTKAIERVRASRAKVRQLTTDSAEQQHRLDDLDPLMERRLRMLDEAVAKKRARAPGAPPDPDETRAGTVATAQVLAVVSALRGEETRLLAIRERDTDESVRQTRMVQVGGTVATFGILFFAFGRLRREVSRRAASEQRARLGEENLATTLQSIGDGVISTDAKGCVAQLNPIAQTLTGFTNADARGRPFAEVFRIVNEMTGEPALDPIERVLREGAIVGLANHTVLIAKDGTKRPIADSAAPIRDISGSITGVVLVFRDMTEERLAAVKLREASSFLDSIVENIPHMIFVKEAAELRFERFNRAGEDLLATSRDALLGKNDFDFFPRAQAEFFQAKDREVLAGPGVVDIPEEPIDTPHGQRWLHTKKIPIRDADGRPTYMLGISEDITERKILIDELRRSRDDLERRVESRTAELRQANEELRREAGEREQAEAALRASEEQLRQSQKMEAVGRLAGGIAHDFNNLLSVILSYSTMLTENLAPGDSVRADLEEIRRAGERAADLTRQLLAFSRQQVLAPAIVDLNDVILSMDKLLNRVIGEDIELRTLPAVRLGKVLVDPSQVEQVIMNLVVNARDAMPEGGRLTIETANVQLDQTYAADHEGVVPGPHVMLAVTDTGVGIDRLTQERIFEPFFTTKEHGKGTGLGLSTVFGIIKQSGGHIWVYSELGKGTAFKVYFPRATDRAASEGRSIRPGTVPPRGHETILLVEDEDQVRVLARNILTRSGYQVIDAKNASEAIMLCERFSGTIHLLTTDLVMPKMSGRQLAERLAPVRPDMKVLFMSGYTDDTVVRFGVLEGGAAFLQKPITPETLIRKVRDVLDGAMS